MKEGVVLFDAGVSDPREIKRGTGTGSRANRRRPTMVCYTTYTAGMIRGDPFSFLFGFLEDTGHTRHRNGEVGVINNGYYLSHVN